MEHLRVMGAPPEMVETWRKALGPDPDEFVLLPELHDVVRVFDAMGTQWDRAGSEGVKVGLKYNRIGTVMRALELPRTRFPEVFADLQVLERETLEAIMERRK